MSSYLEMCPPKAAFSSFQMQPMFVDTVPIIEKCCKLNHTSRKIACDFSYKKLQRSINPKQIINDNHLED